MLNQDYKEPVTDDQLVALIKSEANNTSGRWLSASELSVERQKSLYEYAGIARGHLTPNGVSSIVSTDTTETVEAYLAIISELMFNNNKIARFTPYDASPSAIEAARQASDLTNYCIFRKNKGWEIMNTWVKSALLWKTAVIRWDYIEDFHYDFLEFDNISESALDLELSQPNVEVVHMEPSETLGFYIDVRLKKKIDHSRVKLENVPPENFMVNRDATSIEDASFIGIRTEMSRSDIRKEWPDVAANIKDWSDLASELNQSQYDIDRSIRQEVVGLTAGFLSSEMLETEATQIITITECWIKVDRDGDGIAELKRILLAGNTILFEEDVESVNLAVISPFEIPHEFYGLSIADMTRSSTLASTAILRGFVENTYLTNYSPKLADPNVVDFSALTNLKPKSIIPTNGNPQGAVASLPPENISTGTVPLLEFLQLHKEQATGMSKAAQGLQDELFVSGNSEAKLGQVMSASQKRIQHIVRRFAESGFKRMIEGVYTENLKNMDNAMIPGKGGVYSNIDISKLPKRMDLEVDIDLGENSNANKREKLMALATGLLPLVMDSEAKGIVKPEAMATIAYQLLQSMDLDPADYLVDHTTEEFMQQAAEQQKQAAEETQKQRDIADKKVMAEIDQMLSNVSYTKAQADNTIQDNVRQTAVAIDKSLQEWSKLYIENEVQVENMPQRQDMAQLLQQAQQFVATVKNTEATNQPQPQGPQDMMGGGQPQ